MLKKHERELLERIRDQSGTLLVLQVTASGGMTLLLESLIARDFAEIVDHPTVKERGKRDRPAAALAITEIGKVALDDKAGTVHHFQVKGGGPIK